MKVLSTMMKLGGALLIAAPVLCFAATQAAKPTSADASDYAPIKRMVILHLYLSREGSAVPAATMDLVGVEGQTTVQKKTEHRTDDFAMCEMNHVANGECPTQTNIQVVDEQTTKVVATPHVQSDSRVLVKLDIQNSHADNIAVGERSDYLGNVAYKGTLELQPGVPLTAAAGKGWTITASTKVMDLMAADQRAALAPRAAAATMKQ